MNSAVEAAYERVNKAERERDAIIQSTYAIGDRIAYRHGKNEVLVDVIGHWGDRLQVCSLKDGRHYWIGAYRVTV